MTMTRNNHYVPQFYLRNFAVDSEKKKVTSVAKNDEYAVWSTRSIENIGFERDLYVTLSGGVTISIDPLINQRIETPISRSDTWAKIVSGKVDTLDKSDKPTLYSLIRHLEVRTPKYLQTKMELARLATDRANSMAFTEMELAHYAHLQARPDEAKAMHNFMALWTGWTANDIRRSGLWIFRSPIPIRTLCAPVMAIPAPHHPAIDLPLPGMTPFQLVLALDPRTVAVLVAGDFDDGFVNIEIDAATARGFNRHYVAHFSEFDGIAHLISDREDLIEDMTWAHFEIIEYSEKKIKFRRRLVK